MFPLPGWGRHRQQQKMQDIHLASETDQILQDNCMFTHIHLTQEDSWHPVRETIATHTNIFSTQQEQKGMTSLSKRITITSLLHQSKTEDLIEGIIRNKKQQIKLENTTPLINDLEMQEVFKDKDGERGGSVIDLIYGLVDLLSLETQVV